MPNNFISEFLDPSDILYAKSVFNSSLSNPLNTSLYCAGINPFAEYTGGRKVQNYYWLKDNKYINISLGKSISQRIWVRNFSTNFPAFESPAVSMGLLAKHSLSNTSLIGSKNTDEFPTSGYEFAFGKKNDFGGLAQYIYVGFGGVNNTMNRFPIIENNNSLGTNWIGLRMDVIPVVGTGIVNGVPTQLPVKDIVKFYTATRDAPENWTLVYTRDILFGSDEYVPWGKYKINTTLRYNSTGEFNTYSGTEIDSYNGFGYYSQNFGVVAGANTFKMYFSNYKIYVRDAF